MNKISAWAYIYKACHQLTSMEDSVGPLAERRGIKPRSIFILAWMRRFEPEITLERYLRLAPYSHPERIRSMFTLVEEQGLIQKTEVENHYSITDLGRSIIDELIGISAEELSKLQPISENNLNDLEKLVQKAAYACWSSPLPLDKFVSQSLKNFGPAENASVMERIDFYLAVMFFFRDDVHNSIWKELGFDAHAWEVLTTTWRKETVTLEGILEALSIREYPREATEGALSKLWVNGLVGENNGIYQITEKGKELREKAENRTEELYNAALLTLPEEEIQKLRRLLKLFCSGLSRIQKKQQGIQPVSSP